MPVEIGRLRFVTEADNSQFNRAMDDVPRRAKSTADRASAAFKGSFAGNVAANAVGMLTQRLEQGALAILEYSSNLEQAKIGFTTLMGSASLAEKHLQDLQNFAKTTPFEFAGLVGASRKLQGVGVEAAKVIPLMRDIGNAAAAAGASSAQLDSITRAFSQIIAKGKLSAEEVNQLAEHGIPAWQLLSHELDLTKAQVIDLAEKGQISSEIFLAAFSRFSQMNFGGAMEAQSKTFAGAMSNLKDMAMIAADEGFKPLYTEIARYANRMVENESEVKSWGKATNDTLQAIIDGMKGANAEASKEGGLWNATKSGLDAFDWWLRNVNPLTKGFSDWGESMRVAGAQLRNLQDGVDVGGTKMKLDPTTFTLVAEETEKIKKNVDNTKPLAMKLQSKEAEKQLKALTDIARNLAFQIMFFGNESEVAATKQALLSAGVHDFSEAQASAALAMAATLDRLKAEKKAADDWTESLKAATDELSRFTEDADFELKFPKATELDRFNDWVSRVGRNFGALSGQIDITRQKIRNLLIDRDAGVRNDAIKEFTEQIRELRKEAGEIEDTFDERFREVIGQGLNAFDLNAKQLDQISTFARDAIREWEGALQEEAEGTKMVGFANNILNGIKEQFSKFKLPSGAQIFADDVDNLDKFVQLWNALVAVMNKEKFQQIDAVFQNLGLRFETLDGKVFGAKTQLDEVNEILSSAHTTQLIEQRAKAIGMTADELQRAMRAAADPRLLYEALARGDRIPMGDLAKKADREKWEEMARLIIDTKSIEQGYYQDTELWAERRRNAVANANREMWEAEQQAIIDLAVAHERLQHTFEFSTNQLRATIAEFLAEQPNLQEFTGDLAIQSMGDAFGAVNDSVDMFVEKMGLAETAVGRFISTFISGLIKLALMKIFQQLFSAALGGLGGGIGGTGSIGGMNSTIWGSVGYGAAGDWIDPQAGGKPMITGEGGYPEVILSTDPKHAQRSRGLLNRYLRTMAFTLAPNYGAKSTTQSAVGFMAGSAGTRSEQSFTIINNFHANKDTGAFSRPSAEQQARQMASIQEKAMKRG